MSDEKITITIDGRDVQAERGATVLEAAQKAGIHIPTLCHHDDLCSEALYSQTASNPHQGDHSHQHEESAMLSTPSSCRLCLVEVEGLKTLQASCSLPVNGPMLEHFREAGLDSLFFYALRCGRSSVFGGRHLFLGGSTALTALPDVRPPILFGDLSGITALNLPVWAERYLYEPGTEIAQMADWPAKLAASEETPSMRSPSETMA